jgi:hypothetical protein
VGACTGSVGIPRSYATTQPDAETITEPQQASKTAQREAHEGNKDNPALARKSYDNDQARARHEEWAAGLSKPGRSPSTGLDLVKGARCKKGGGNLQGLEFLPLSRTLCRDFSRFIDRR